MKNIIEKICKMRWNYLHLIYEDTQSELFILAKGCTHVITI